MACAAIGVRSSVDRAVAPRHAAHPGLRWIAPGAARDNAPTHRHNHPLAHAQGMRPDALVSRGVSREGAAFLQKPFSYETLVAKVREVLDRPAPVPARDDERREAA